MTREDIALRILCAYLADTSGTFEVCENSVRMAFKIAEVFEKVSDELGGRPSRTPTPRRGPFMDTDDDDD